MLVDMHMHEKTCSKDSFLSLEEIVDIAKQRGLDAVCITDHDSMGLQEYAAEFVKRTGFPVFVGVEYYTLQGDITAFGIGSFPDRRIDAQDFINEVNAAGGFCVSCHPFRNNNRGLEDNLRRVKGLHGVEVLNGSTTMEANRTALRYARELGLQTIGASDCHIRENVAKYVTWLPEKVTTLSDFVDQLHRVETRPAIWMDDHYDILTTF